MKKIIFYLFYRRRFDRSVNIKNIREERISRIRETISYLNKWDDIPLSFTFTAICDRLKIAPNDAAKKFIIDLCMPGVDLHKMARKLP